MGGNGKSWGWLWKRCNKVLDPQLSIIILNLQEGQPDNPAMDTHFMINLNMQQIHDKFQDMCQLFRGSAGNYK